MNSITRQENRVFLETQRKSSFENCGSAVVSKRTDSLSLSAEIPRCSRGSGLLEPVRRRARVRLTHTVPQVMGSQRDGTRSVASSRARQGASESVG